MNKMDKIYKGLNSFELNKNYGDKSRGHGC